LDHLNISHFIQHWIRSTEKENNFVSKRMEWEIKIWIYMKSKSWNPSLTEVEESCFRGARSSRRRESRDSDNRRTPFEMNGWLQKGERKKWRSLNPERQQVNAIFNILPLIGQSECLAPEFPPQICIPSSSRNRVGKLLQFCNSRTAPAPPDLYNIEIVYRDEYLHFFSLPYIFAICRHTDCYKIRSQTSLAFRPKMRWLGNSRHPTKSSLTTSALYYRDSPRASPHYPPLVHLVLVTGSFYWLYISLCLHRFSFSSACLCNTCKIPRCDHTTQFSATSTKRQQDAFDRRRNCKA